MHVGVRTSVFSNQSGSQQRWNWCWALWYMGYFKITDGERLFLNVCCLVLVLEGNVETYKEERGMFYKPSKNVCSGLFLVNTFPEMYSFKKQ